jgi:hypothetical protein
MLWSLWQLIAKERYRKLFPMIAQIDFTHFIE